MTGDLGGELSKGSGQMSRGGIAVKMVRLDVEDRGMLRVEVEKIGSVFACFGDDQGTEASAATRWTTQSGGAADHGGVPTSEDKQVGEHGRGGGFAVGPRNGNTLPFRHETPKHLEVAAGGDSQFGGAEPLGIIGGDSIAVNDELGVRGDVFWGVERLDGKSNGYQRF